MPQEHALSFSSVHTESHRPNNSLTEETRKVCCTRCWNSSHHACPLPPFPSWSLPCLGAVFWPGHGDHKPGATGPVPPLARRAHHSPGPANARARYPPRRGWPLAPGRGPWRLVHAPHPPGVQGLCFWATGAVVVGVPGPCLARKCASSGGHGRKEEPHVCRGEGPLRCVCVSPPPPHVPRSMRDLSLIARIRTLPPQFFKDE